ncbi:MAG TPA: selenocysteine-specific translation elongation factor [Fimbriimonadaceae bacterium]|nr:selenocysteine-specific translation elongation factor [Fimbriimonadaceae bacterium]
MAKLIGTAGHVDHGKTTLIQALTGIDADRLPEEKRRGMTIDIGFAYLDFPEFGRVSIVDVPGHERFLTNMLVGALGIDVALLCVAADESVMPQTREHVQILDLLPVERMVVALTRSDLADETTREISKAEIEELLAPTRFKGAPILEVSAPTGAGIPELRQALLEALRASTPEGLQDAPWYLPIDRVFTVKGHGAVVTGTLAQGLVKIGERAYIQPENLEVRVRAIHSHGVAAETGEPGRRIALNLSGVKEEDLRRGQAVGAPGALFATDCFDAKMRWATPVKHGSRVRVSIGADEAIGRVFLNDFDPELAQVRLESRIAAALDQPLILRRYSPPDVLGGGRILIPQARRRKKGEEIRGTRPAGDEEAILGVIGASPDGVVTEEVCRLVGKSQQTLGKPFENLLSQGKVYGFAGLWFSVEGFEEGWKRFMKALEGLHEKNPSTASVARERVLQAAGLPWTGKPLDRILAAMVQRNRIVLTGTSVRSPSFRVSLSPKQRQFLDRIVAALTAEPVNTPNPHRLSELLSVPMQAVEEVLRLGVQAGEVVSLGEGVFYTPAQLDALKKRTAERMGTKPFAAAQLRDALGTTRKYIIPLLEHFDATRFTTRVGDNRIVNRAS